MKNNLISIIIPVYNGERWLSAAVNSALSQTHRNVEIIIVDDGSTDNSLELCKSFTIDSRVKVFNKQNGGQSSARNYGLLHACGEYIMFLDCDDSLVADACETVLNVMKPDVDFVLYGFNVYRNGTILRNPHPEVLQYNGSYEDFQKFSWLMASPCNKLYRRSYISTTFNENCVYGEDGLFNFGLFQKGTKVICTDKCLYNVNLDNPNSVNKRYKPGRLKDTILSLNVKLSKIENIFGSDKAKRDYWADGLTSLAFTILLCATKSSYSGFRQEMNSAIYVNDANSLFDKVSQVQSDIKAHNRLILYLTKKHLTTILYLLSKMLNLIK